MSSNIVAINPPNLGWLEKKLSDIEINRLWDYVNERNKASVKNTLAGHIQESNALVDTDNWFFQNTLVELCIEYEKVYRNIGKDLPTKRTHPYCLEGFWVNYQRENEFNPLHIHRGVYSFVIWMKIPTDYDEQNSNPLASTSISPSASAFQFFYTDILGSGSAYKYPLNKNWEGMLVFFPSQLEHAVNPFYNCSDDRISISGNILLDV